MKKWTYDGDIDCRHGGRWLKTQNLLDREGMVEVVLVDSISERHELYMVLVGHVYISHKQENWQRMIEYAGIGEELVRCAMNGMTVDYWRLVAQGFCDYDGIEPDERWVVAIGKDVPEDCNGFSIDRRLRSDAKLENYIYKHFLKGA